MAIPAQVRNQLLPMIDAVYEARETGVQYMDNVRLEFGGRTLKLRVEFNPMLPDEIRITVFWRPVPGA